MSNIFFLDFETTGLSPYLNDVIEIAIKKIKNENTFECLVKPKKINGSYTYVPPHIVKLTGITDKEIHTNGIAKTVATQQMFNYIVTNSDLEKPIYIVAHNGVSFDFIFFRRLVDEYIKNIKLGIDENIFKSINYIDTILIGKSFPNKFNSYKQSYLCSKYNIENLQEHRAKADVIALEELFINLCNDYSKSKDKDKDYYLNNPNEIVQYI